MLSLQIIVPVGAKPNSVHAPWKGGTAWSVGCGSSRPQTCGRRWTVLYSMGGIEGSTHLGGRIRSSSSPHTKSSRFIAYAYLAARPVPGREVPALGPVPHILYVCRRIRKPTSIDQGIHQSNPTLRLTYINPRMMRWKVLLLKCRGLPDSGLTPFSPVSYGWAFHFSFIACVSRQHNEYMHTYKYTNPYRCRAPESWRRCGVRPYCRGGRRRGPASRLRG